MVSAIRKPDQDGKKMRGIVCDPLPCHCND